MTRLSVFSLFITLFFLSFNAGAGGVYGKHGSAFGRASYVDDELIKIGTGSVTGIYYQAGNSICRLINRERKPLGLRCIAESTPGSIFNVNSLRHTDIDFAIVQSDWQEHAYNGTSIFAKEGRFDKLRSIMSLHNEAFAIIVPHESTINTLDDIRDKIIDLGPIGSGARTTMDDVMKAKNWTKFDFKSFAEFKPSNQAQALCSGTVDAIIMVVGHANESIEKIARSCEIRLIDVNDSTIQKLVSANPEFVTTVIPGGTYSGVPNDTLTFGVRATLVTTSEVDEDRVYDITKIIFENLDIFKAQDIVFSHLEAQEMVVPNDTAPLHPGAHKYFVEKGFIVESEAEEEGQQAPAN